MKNYRIGLKKVPLFLVFSEFLYNKSVIVIQNLAYVQAMIVRGFCCFNFSVIFNENIIFKVLYPSSFPVKLTVMH